MSRTQPAYFDVKGPDGRRWRVRVGPLGIECLTHEATAYQRPGCDMVFHHGQERHAITWADLLEKVCDVER